jgi:hypothetical protein
VSVLGPHPLLCYNWFCFWYRRTRFRAQRPSELTSVAHLCLAATRFSSTVFASLAVAAQEHWRWRSPRRRGRDAPSRTVPSRLPMTGLLVQVGLLHMRRLAATQSTEVSSCDPCLTRVSDLPQRYRRLMATLRIPLPHHP